MSDEGGHLKIVSEVIEKLGGDPCLLAIVVMLVVAAWIIHRTYKHVERMEKLRLDQSIRVLGKEEKEPLPVGKGRK